MTPAASSRTHRPSFTGLTVQGWFRLVFAIIAVLVIVAAGVIAYLVVDYQSVSNELVASVLPAQAQAYRLQAALVDQETGVRGYALTGNAAFLQPYTAGRATEASAVAQLQRLIGGNPMLAADLHRLQRAASSWQADYSDRLMNLAKAGPLSGRDLGLLVSSKQSFDHLRTLFGTQNANLAARAKLDGASLSRTRAIRNWSYAAILAVFLLAAGALTMALQKAVVRPLNELRDAARRVMAGNFDRHIEPTGPSDLRAVAADIEAMRSELVTALAGARAAEDRAVRQAADLDAQAAELLRSNAELEQFAYVASHDLQEPLRKVASFCQLLEKRYGQVLDDRGRQYIYFAVDGSRRLQVLINDLLTFSRVGRAGDARTAVPLDQPLDMAIGALAAVIEESGAVIERPERLPEVAGDRTLLTMLWQNLIGNAIKFRAPDRDPVVQITAADQGDGKWEFCVTDNGIGIAPEFAEKVFVIFQRLHGRDAYPGTGIGLALCRRIVEHHGGTVRIDQDYSGGTRMCFTLPAADPARLALANGDQAGGAGGGSDGTGGAGGGSDGTGGAEAGSDGTGSHGTGSDGLSRLPGRLPA